MFARSSDGNINSSSAEELLNTAPNVFDCTYFITFLKKGGKQIEYVSSEQDQWRIWICLSKQLN